MSANSASGPPGRFFLATYRPLVLRPEGREAARAHGLPPFIDGSCRREPDFESAFPSITATCRAGNFAPHLQERDTVAYITVKGRYLDDREAGWRLVAVLRVVHRFESHAEAASWYKSKGQPLPSNCLVRGNQPKPLRLTNRRPPQAIRKKLLKEKNSTCAVQMWDDTYQARVRHWPVFLVTEAEFLELDRPPELSPADMQEVFGRIPFTLTPAKIRGEQLAHLVALATGRSAWHICPSGPLTVNRWLASGSSYRLAAALDRGR
jgi:hypothetical protein